MAPFPAVWPGKRRLPSLFQAPRHTSTRSPSSPSKAVVAPLICPSQLPPATLPIGRLDLESVAWRRGSTSRGSSLCGVEARLDLASARVPLYQSDMPGLRHGSTLHPHQGAPQGICSSREWRSLHWGTSFHCWEDGCHKTIWKACFHDCNR